MMTLTFDLYVGGRGITVSFIHSFYLVQVDVMSDLYVSCFYTCCYVILFEQTPAVVRGTAVEVHDLLT